MLIDLDALLQRVGSKYQAVILAAKRARQIVNGAVPLVEPQGTKPVSIALEELVQGRLEYRTGEGEPAPAAVRAVDGAGAADETAGADHEAAPDTARA